MLVVTTDNSIYFVEGFFRKIELGEPPIKIKWGRINSKTGTIQQSDGELLQLLGAENQMIISSTEFGVNRKIHPTVERIIE